MKSQNFELLQSMKKLLLLAGIFVSVAAIGYAKYTDLGGSGGGGAGVGATGAQGPAGPAGSSIYGQTTVGGSSSTITALAVVSPAGNQFVGIAGSSYTVNLSSFSQTSATETISGGKLFTQGTTIQNSLQAPALRLLSMNAYPLPLLIGNNAASTLTGIGFQNGSISTNAAIGYTGNGAIMTFGVKGNHGVPFDFLVYDGGATGGVSFGTKTLTNASVVAITTGAGTTGSLLKIATGTTDIANFTGVSVNFGVTPIFNGYNSCTALETDGSGKLVCGSDGGGAGSGENFDLFIATLPTNAVRVGSMTVVGTITSTSGFIVKSATITELTVGGTGSSSLTPVGGPLTINGDLAFQTTWYTGVAFPFDAGSSSRIVSGSVYGVNGRFMGDGQQSSGPANCGYFQKFIPQNYVTGSTPTLTGLVEISTGLVSQQTQWLIDFATSSIVSVSTGLVYTSLTPVVVTGTTIGSGGIRTNTTDVTIRGLWSILGSGEKFLIVRARRDGANATPDPAQSETSIGNIGLAFRVQQ
jgi:hypothetical protein